MPSALLVRLHGVATVLRRRGPMVTAWELLEELGVSRDGTDVRQFVERHSLLAKDVRLVDAHFWTPFQRSLLVEYMEDESWQDAVDELDHLMRNKPQR